MRIAVIDVAAEFSGALSVLNDFVDSLTVCESSSHDEWYIFTSIVDVKESRNIHNIKCPKVKKSWFHRLYWEYKDLPIFLKKYQIDIIFSLQNNAMPIDGIRQIVYFHNILLSQDDMKFSIFRKEERAFAIYTKLLAPYIRWTWKRADLIVVQGESVKQQVARYFPPEKICVCRPNINLKDIQKIEGKIKGYVFPATPYIYKNYEIIVDAARDLQRRGKQVEVLLTITGNENGYAKKIKDLAIDTKGIKLIGFLPRTELIDLYKKYGLIMTSKLESFSVPILEALSAGTVIVGIRKPYVLEHFQRARYNRMYLFDDNSEALAAAMEAGLKDTNKGNYIFDLQKNSMKKLIHIIKDMR